MLLSQVLAHTFGHAADNTDNQVSAALTAQRVQRLKACDDFLLGVVADRASVQQNSIGAVD